MIRICWGALYWEVGNAYGYSVHNRAMFEQIQKYAVLDPDAPLALTIASADRFNPVPGKYNVLFTMFETPDIPSNYVAGIRKADELIVPCTWLEGVFRKYTDKRISVCTEGTDPDVFTYKERQFPRSRPFRVLWVGAPNIRKGYHYMVEIARHLQNDPRFEVYIKTTAPKPPDPAALQKALDEHGLEAVVEFGESRVRRAIEDTIRRLKKGGADSRLERLGPHRNVIVDTRDLKTAELVELYHSAHLFVLPSLGEGFGLTLCEAMSTGLPCIAPPVTGMRDFFDSEVGYPCRYKWIPHILPSYRLRTHIVWPDVEDVFRLIGHVYTHYDAALMRGRRAAERIRDGFTWSISGARLASILQEAERRRNECRTQPAVTD